MTNHKKDKKVNKLWRHAEVFTDFWLGMAGAGARGLSEALQKPDTENDATKPLILENTVDRAARAIQVTLKRASLAARDAEKELAAIRTDQAKQTLRASTVDALMDAAKKLSSHPPPPKEEAAVLIWQTLALVTKDNQRDSASKEKSS